MTYDEILNFNSIISWIHSLRYRQTQKYVAQLTRQLKRPVRILEIGCANGKLFGLLKNNYAVEYLGVEINEPFVKEATDKYHEYNNFHIRLGDATDPSLYKGWDSPDLIICLETLEHMPREKVSEVLQIVKNLKPGIFLCSVPVEIGPSVLIKNIVSWIFGYHRHKNYTWRETSWASVYRLDKLPPHNGCHKGFDWRWLHDEIKSIYPRVKAKSIPFSVLPKFLANSVYFVGGDTVTSK